jgi:serine/threonine protein kinase
MTPEMWERLKPIFYAAMEKPKEERARFIDEQCGNDRELREEAHKLINASGESTGLADVPLVNFHNFFPEPKDAFTEGEVVMGRYKIIGLISKGGMGEVYKATDLKMGPIALKTIRADIAGYQSIIDRFKKEVELAQKISGPHVCRIHDLKEATNNRGQVQSFLTMEYLDGVTLAERIDKSGPVPWRELKTIALDICEGLRVMHEVGIIHRDLKCRNVMLAARNGAVRAVVMDFGLAYEVRSVTTETATDVDADDEMVGTPEYMAPEQFAGEPITPASDIFALGVVMYELATGKAPFPANNTLQAAVQRGRKPPPPSSIQKGLPPSCDQVVGKCLEFDPKKRYQSASQVAKALNAGPLNIANLRRNHPWVFRVACGLILAVIGWGSFRSWQWYLYDRPNPTALKWYNAGVAALREGSYVKATRLLTSSAESDSHFAMTHARLAEAWANLDFDGKSSQEMLIALGGEHHLRPLDSLYLNAIHATLRRDYPGAVSFYRGILDQLPDDNVQRAAGYVDLGMAYERAGDPTHAHECFIKSESLDSDNPAAYMREAILDTRLHNVNEANRAFSQAEAIFAREMNQEGQAELDYERGYEANQEDNSEQANQFLKQSLQEAEKIQDVQLEIRVLNQLSSVACVSGHAPEAAELAQRSIRLARDSQLEAWAAMGLTRLAFARTSEGSDHYAEADDAVNEARTLAHQSQQDRAEALANVALASLRDQQHRSDEVIPPATAALAYYKQNGYFEPAANATLLILRANETRGEFKQTLQTANEFLDLAEKSGSKDLQMQAEQHIGMTYRGAERYPEALPHFQRALTLAEGETYRAYQAMNCAAILIKLGRFADADALLQSIDGVPAVAADVGNVRLEALLIQEKYSQALPLTNTLITGHPEMMSDLKEEIEHKRSISEAHLHRNSDALTDLQQATQADDNSDPAQRWEIALEVAEVKILCGRPQEARDEAIAAEEYFTSKGQLDSALRADLLVVTASKVLNDSQNNGRYSAKAVDILSTLEHNWGPEAFHSYSSRPDLRTLMRALPPRAAMQIAS